ncbi:MAG: UDP-N-acetylmuramoyl-tripeptide--D-alanyl-D-alanine ligase [Spirochaetia bacterium]|nr:UDP-N-acetylmuramoyl-tripeptide--D-alanyl-D-alanine ligase [Spirochaetia bacterium]MCF7946451.1 UDP-N-acetylmuramoyl-tripeptide--D-alanyl-D-alanine ligase [Spirochaetia bacterium]
MTESLTPIRSSNKYSYKALQNSTPLFTFSELQNIISGSQTADQSLPSNRIHYNELKRVRINQITIDSRIITGDTASTASRKGINYDSPLFIPLPGFHVNGHQYVPQALTYGAAALVSNKEWPKLQKLIPDYWKKMILIVPDTLKALHELAAHWVKQCSIKNTIAVTGSTGKTTTKELIYSILSLLGPTVKNYGNLNSIIGLPLSVFRMRPNDEYAVFEMGIDHKGEMEELTNIFAPSYGVLTNIGNAHLENFGTQENIAREKSQIFSRETVQGYTHENNIWKPYIERLRSKQLESFGLSRFYENSMNSAVPVGLNGWKMNYAGREIQFPLIGTHNLENALAAISVAENFGADADDIKKGLERVRPLFGRSRIIHGPVTIIEDCYNANEESMRSILHYLSTLHWKGRMGLILGDMKELGADTDKAHRMVGKAVNLLAPSAVFLYGKEMETAYRLLKEKNFTNELMFTDDISLLEEKICSYKKKGDLFLIKGSRAMGLERLVGCLRSA